MSDKAKPIGMTVCEVEPHSAAFRAGMRAGDRLLQINGRSIHDILDYRFHSGAARVCLTYERDGAICAPTVRVKEDEDLGLSFDDDLGDGTHVCNNRCMFCFIHQMPKGMRRSLYLKDDDFRLSFMHGNYITLTNMGDAEFAKVLEQRLSPMYVSVHATNPELRGRLLGKREPEPVLPRLSELASGRVDVHAQVVLCPGVNDGEALLQTIDDLAQLHPAVSGKRAGVQSVAVVPVGLTQFRSKLPDLTKVTPEYAREMTALMKPIGAKLTRELGTRFVWLSDEWYHQAGVTVPSAAYYEDFPQLDDGIGTLRLFLDDAKRLARKLPSGVSTPVNATLVTAELPAGVVQGFAQRLNEIDGVDLTVCVVKNEFFGGGINIAGLLTGHDIIKQVNACSAAATVYIPAICLRDGEVFLDDLTLEDVSQQTGRRVLPVGIKPHDLVSALNIR